MAGLPLRTAIDRCLGELLPHQQADRPQPPPLAAAEAAVYLLRDVSKKDHPALPIVSNGYSDLRGRLVTCYSPFRRFTRPKTFAHDLHA